MLTASLTRILLSHRLNTTFITASSMDSLRRGKRYLRSRSIGRAEVLPTDARNGGNDFACVRTHHDSSVSDAGV